MKIKNIFLASVAFLATLTAIGQTSLDKLEANKDIATVVVSQKMFQMLSKIDSKDADAKEFMENASRSDRKQQADRTAAPNRRHRPK